MKRPLVSAIVATYNRADVVGQAIKSILAQTYKNIEVIVVDDGSTDGTGEVLQRFGNRLRIFRQENAGPSAARNRGITAATGDIITFLDSDDIWLPQKTERQVALLERAGDSVPCCLCNTTLQFSDGTKTTSFDHAWIHSAYADGIWTNAAEVLTTRFLMFNQAVAIRSDFLARTGGFDETLKYLEDLDLALRLSLLGPFAFIAEPLAVYHHGSAGSLAEESLKKKIKLKEYMVRIREHMHEAVRTNGHYAQLQGPVRRALRKARRELWLAHVAQWQIPGAVAVSNFLERAGHSYDGMWDPNMETASVPDQEGCLSKSRSELREIVPSEPAV